MLVVHGSLHAALVLRADDAREVESMLSTISRLERLEPAIAVISAILALLTFFKNGSAASSRLRSIALLYAIIVGGIALAFPM